MRKTAIALHGGLPGGAGGATADRGHGVEGAPVVAASGQGAIADQIIALAEANGVPVERDPALAAALGQLRIGQAIPPELYQAVAELLVFLYDLDARQGDTPALPAMPVLTRASGWRGVSGTSTEDTRVAG